MKKKKNIIKKIQLKEKKFLFNHKWEHKYFFLKKKFRNKFLKNYLHFYKCIHNLFNMFKYFKFKNYFFKDFFQINKYFYVNTKNNNINLRYNNILQNFKNNNIKYYNYICGNILLSNQIINIQLVYKYLIISDNFVNITYFCTKQIYYYNYINDYKILISFIIL